MGECDRSGVTRDCGKPGLPLPVRRRRRFVLVSILAGAAGWCWHFLDCVMQPTILPILLLVLGGLGLCAALLVMGLIINPRRRTAVKAMPYESGVDPVHDARRRVDVQFYLLAIAFLVFDVELLFLYPWAVASRPAIGEALPVPVAAVQSGSQDVAAASPPAVSASESPNAGEAPVALASIDDAVAAGAVESRGLVFGGAMTFIGLLALGLVYDWRKGVFQWR